MIRIRGDEDSGYVTLVTCDECHDSMVFQPGHHGLWVGSARQVRMYLTEHKGWVWDDHSASFYCPEHFGAGAGELGTRYEVLESRHSI